MDIQAEVMRVQGELHVANQEIDRLRGVLSDQNLGVSLEKQPVTRESIPQSKPQTQQEEGFAGAEETFGKVNKKAIDETKLKGRQEFKLNMGGVNSSAIKSAANPAPTGLAMPKLNLGGLKQNVEYRDWYQYALKLEDSVKFLRQRIKSIEDDLENVNTKYRAEKKSKEETLAINQRLVAALNTAKSKIHEVKAKYRSKVKKHGVNDSMSVGSDMLDRSVIQQQEAMMGFDEYAGNNFTPITSNPRKQHYTTVDNMQRRTDPSPTNEENQDVSDKYGGLLAIPKGMNVLGNQIKLVETKASRNQDDDMQK